MDEEVAELRLAGVAVPVGAVSGAIVAFLLGSKLVAGALAGVTVGVLTVAIIVPLYDRVSDRWLTDPRQLALGAVIGGLVAAPAALFWSLADSIALTNLLLILLSGGTFGGFLGYMHQILSNG